LSRFQSKKAVLSHLKSKRLGLHQRLGRRRFFKVSGGWRGVVLAWWVHPHWAMTRRR
jgi:hypothetical protein